MDKIKSAITVVCDAGPVIHLDELGRLDLFKDFHEVLLPNTVWEEINRYRPATLNKADLPFVKRPGKTPSREPLLTLCKIFSLDAGEAEALALMEKRPQAMFLTDDAAARLVAIQMGFDVHGTIGILVRSIRRGQPDEPQRSFGHFYRYASEKYAIYKTFFITRNSAQDQKRV